MRKRQRNQDGDELAKRNNIIIKTPVKVATFTMINGIIPLERYGEHSPMLACDDMEMIFVFAHAKSICALYALFSAGDVPTDDDILFDWQCLDKYLDVPILFQISNNKTWQNKGDENLWLFKLQGYKQSYYNADWAAVHGHLEILKWIRTNGGDWTSKAADWAAGNGHLATLKWIRANGGKWTSYATAFADANGQLDTLKWIRDNGGEKSSHEKTVIWIHNFLNQDKIK